MRGHSAVLCIKVVSFLWMDVWYLTGPSDGVSCEPLSEVMARGTGLWKRLAASLLNYSEVENIKKKRRETTEEAQG